MGFCDDLMIRCLKYVHEVLPNYVNYGLYFPHTEKITVDHVPAPHKLSSYEIILLFLTFLAMTQFEDSIQLAQLSGQSLNPSPFSNSWKIVDICVPARLRMCPEWSYLHAALELSILRTHINARSQQDLRRPSKLVWDTYVHILFAVWTQTDHLLLSPGRNSFSIHSRKKKKAT